MFPLNFPPKQNLSITCGSREATCHGPLLDPGPSNSSPETAAFSQEEGIWSQLTLALSSSALIITSALSKAARTTLSGWLPQPTL